MFGQNKPFGGGASFGNSSGGSSLFGNTSQNKSLFGTTTNTQNTGTSSLFGNNQANKPAGSLFGGASQQQNSLFGSPQQQQQGTSSLFGNAGNANKSLFGGNTTTNTGGGGLFGNSNTSMGGSGLFGSNNATTSGTGLFGSSVSTVNGTTIKFEPLIGSDTMMKNGSQQSISTKHMCITAMAKYENKSVEELRVEDYMANRKAPGAGTTTTGSGGLFGSSTTNNQTTTGGGLFGNSTPQKSLFGTTSNSSPFGGNTAQTGSLFGNANNSNQGSLFGNKPATGGLFGSSAAPAATSFGSQPTTSLFGNTQQPQQTTSLFGQQQQTPQQPTSLFGNNSNTGTSLFGNNQQQQPASTGFSFGGGTTTNAFGQPAANTSGGNLFGTTSTANTGTSLFGSKPAQSTGFSFQSNTNNNAFGQNTANTSSGLFGSNTAKPGGLFGNTTNTGTTGGGLFGNQATTNTGGLFGSNTQPTQNLTTGFGTNLQPTVVAQPQVAPIPVIGVTADVLQLQANMKSIQSQLTHAPYGDSPLLKYNKNDKDAKESPMNTQRQLRLLAAKKGGAGSPALEKSSFITAPISKVMGDLSPVVRSADVTRDLQYTSKEAPPTLGRGLRNGTYNPNSSVLGNQSLHDSSIANRTIDSVLESSLNGTSNRFGARGSVRKSNLKQLDLSVLSDTSRFTQNGHDSQSSDPDALPLIVPPQDSNGVASPQNDPLLAVAQRQQNRDQQPPVLNLDQTSDETTCVDKTSAETVTTSSSATSHTSVLVDKSAAGVRLSKPDYFTIPTIEEMKHMVQSGRVVIEDGLTIGRASYGSVFWPGRMELSDIVLDEVVVFRHREVTVYPKEDEKPEEGEELNRPAEVTLERIWFTDKKTQTEIRDIVKLAEIGWREHLERQTIRMGAGFKDYRAETGSWVFCVEHFSKYGLVEDDEPMDVAPPKPQQAPLPLQRVDLNTSDPDIQNQVQRQKVHKERELPESSRDVNRAQIRRMSTSSSSIGNSVPILRLKAPEGLGGGKGDEHDNRHFLNSTIEYQTGDDDEEEMRIEEGQQPEKKPKLELLNDLEYESSRYLRNINDVKVMPKCISATHRFNGGRSEREMIGYGKSRFIDLGITKGRSSQVGWSGVGSLVWSAQPATNQILFGTVDRTSDVNEDTLSSMLDVNVDTSQSIRKGLLTKNRSGGAPLNSNFVTYSDTYNTMLMKYIDISSSGGYDTHCSVWTLCLALFPSSRQNGWKFDRGQNIGEWLKNEASKHSENVRSTGKEDAADGVWQQLCVGNIEKAFEVATDGNLINLASSLYASSISPESTIHCYKKQIEIWQKSEVLHLVPSSILKCYLILSGVSHKEWVLNGKKHFVNCLEGLHWTQALGIHVWYLRGWNGLEEAYAKYVEDVNKGIAETNRGNLYGELIKLACESQHSVEVVLDCAAGESPHDYFLIWHVWSVLHSVGYRTMSKSVETRLHRNYSAQLEDAKLAKYAIFVLQHIENDDERATAVKSLLEKVAWFTDNDLFDAISEEFDVAKEWIKDAQYVVAKPVDDAIQLFELAVGAKNIEEIQRLFVDNIAPTAVVAGDMITLRTACNMIEPLEHLIPEWGANGRIYMDYRQLLDLIDMREDDDELQSILNSLEDRLHAPIFHNTIQKCAVRTIARLVFEHRSERHTIPEWTKILGKRQILKIVRDNVSWDEDSFAIEFK